LRVTGTHTNVLLPTPLHTNKTSKDCIQFLNITLKWSLSLDCPGQNSINRKVKLYDRDNSLVSHTCVFDLN